MRWSRKVAIMGMTIVALAPRPALTQSASGPIDRFAIADTVSPEAAKALSEVYAARSGAAAPIDPVARGQRFAAAQGVVLIDDRIGGVPVVRVRPSRLAATRRTLIYLHGGGFTRGDTRTLVYLPALIANRMGGEVISVEYTLAPHADWRMITGQVVSVWRDLLAKGMDPRSAAIFGDSAGGGLAAGATLRLREEGLALPAALYLVSPWSDVAALGDTYDTLAAADPLLDRVTLSAAAGAYAQPADQQHPYVSPIHGDYARPFPPTLIQCGTREIFLSNCVRYYQALRGGGREAVLDIYEGMPHAFPAYAPDAPETRTAATRAAEFIDARLSAR